MFQGHGLDRQKLIEETGDVLWYVASMAEYLGVPLGEIAEANISKLKKRYPEGFDRDKSVNRACPGCDDYELGSGTPCEPWCKNE